MRAVREAFLRMRFVQLSTRQKIRLAQAMYRIVRAGRRLTGLPMQGAFRRSGLQWHLDLNEGIDFAIWLLGAFERDLVRSYTARIGAGSCVLDLGANIGAHTLPLARCVGPAGRVIAVEATAYAFEKLRANLALNPELESRITAVHALLVATPSSVAESHIYSSWPLSGEDRTHPVLAGALKSVGAARACTVDQLVRELSPLSIAWIKIDVDGHELAVLQGAQSTLQEHQPRILMELAPYCHADQPGQFEALVRWLYNANYTLRHPHSGRELPREVAALQRCIPAKGSLNVLATPSQ